MMKILVLGGSLFLGKCFVKMVKDEMEITVFNRGNQKLPWENVNQLVGDRHAAGDLEQLKNYDFDAVVDFCAYEKGDIEAVFQVLGGNLKQYIFVSTCDVYERGKGCYLDETAGFEYGRFPGEAGAYIAGKVALEKELVVQAKKHNVAFTSVRPAFIYGPDNYAPREGIYFHWISQAGQIIHPEDATGEFQMVYVEDVAQAVKNAIANEKAYNQAFNLSNTQIETYETFAGALKEGLGVSFEKVLVSVEMVRTQNIPLPFPLTKKESNLYDGKKALCLMEKYTTLTEGIRKTVQKGD